MSLPVNQIVRGGVYEGASGQRRRVDSLAYRVIDYMVSYTVVKVGVSPENQPLGTKSTQWRALFARWAVRRIS